MATAAPILHAAEPDDPGSGENIPAFATVAGNRGS